MIKKKYSKKGKKCRVTFKVDAADACGARRVEVLGDFNEWSRGASPLERRKDGSFVATESLRSGRDYRFRYLIDNESWLSDEEADALVSNPFGDLDSVVSVPRPE